MLISGILSLAAFPEDKLTEPDTQITTLALENSKYCVEKEELENLYANLLAKTMNYDTKDLVITIDIKNKNTGGQHPFAKYCSWITDFAPEQCRFSFAVLCRLGIIEIPRQSEYAMDSNYNSVRQNPAFIKIRNECLQTLKENQEIVYVKKYIKLNALSDLFYDICVKDEM